MLEFDSVVTARKMKNCNYKTIFFLNGVRNNIKVDKNSIGDAYES